ncbi:MAG: 1-acyl-sn-glycerol-3-phosphate acyltransferase [Sphingobacteriales bacterium]|nr:1-acyl-sn-glycerol-3-phosphate acyltransferase [Sphingobacteriales bacterium]
MLLLAVTALFASRLKFEEDISRILPRDPGVEKLNEVFRHSKFMDKLVVMVSLKDTLHTDPDSLILFSDELVAQIKDRLAAYVKKISYRVDEDMAMELFNIVNEHLPVYLNEKDYHEIDSLIQPGTLEQTLQHNLQTLSSPAGFALKNMISNDPVGVSFVALRKLQQLQYDENFELYDNCIVTRDHKTLMLFLTPVYPPNNTGKNEQFLNGLDSIIRAKADSGFSNIDARYFGATAVSAGNARQLGKDTWFTQGATLVFLILFIGFYFRRASAPVLIMIPVVTGALFALAMVYLIRGSISVIAVGTGSVILGIAVNYSLHVFNHYRHTGDIRKVITDLAFPLTLGSLTTIGGFFCLNFAASDMLKDLGTFAGFSLIGAALSSLIFLPHFITSSKNKNKAGAVSHSWIDRLATWRPDHNRYIIGTILLLTIAFIVASGHVGFETNLNNMNYMPERLKEAEKKLNRINEAALQSVYIVVDGSNLNQALVNNEKLNTEIEKLKDSNIISKYSGVSALIMSDSLQQKRIDRWNTYWTAAKKETLLKTLQEKGRVLGYSATAFNAFAAMLNKNFPAIDTATARQLRTTFLDDYISEFPDHATVVTLVKVPPEHKETIYNAFAGKPDITVLDRQYLTGKFVALINTDFTSIALITSILVFVILWITYGRIELTLIAFLPMMLSWIWILGLMAVLGIKFNIINIIVSTLIFGLGDDYSIFIMDGLLQEYRTGTKNLSSFKSSILLSAVTTIAGLGVLIFAQHLALRSIAAISVVGILCVVVMAQVFIPWLFSLLITRRTKNDLYPWTAMSLLKTVFSQVWFIGGSIILAVIGFVLVKCNPFNKEKGKYLYHVAIAAFSKSLIYVMGNVKKTIINPLGEDFKKPAVIICNHQSGLDNFVMMMLHPKIIVLTNDRVRSAPISGAVVRMADYFSVSEGAEAGIAKMSEKMKQGYSIVIFPEGTRSSDGNMKRFHKGAFFLAERLKADILPVMLHGTGYALSKGDMMLKDGHIHIHFLPRIPAADTLYGTTYTERAKQIGKYFRSTFTAWKASLEQPGWYREKLFYNYIYKGPVLEWYMRVKVRLEKDYLVFHELLPLEGRFLDAGCGYGFMSYMLHFAAPGRELTGIDYDEEKTTVANHCFSKDAGIHFMYADILRFNFDKYDGIIMADMLHYLPEDEQHIVLQKAIHSLHPGGILIIRDGDSEKEKHGGTKLTEFFSTKVFGFNKTAAAGLSFLTGSMIRKVAADNNMDCREIDETKYTSNVIFVLRKKCNDSSKI